MEPTDKDKILALLPSEGLYLNMFQGGGSYIQRELDGVLGLYEVPLYGGIPMFYKDFKDEDVDELLHFVYNVLI